MSNSFRKFSLDRKDFSESDPVVLNESSSTFTVGGSIQEDTLNKCGIPKDGSVPSSNVNVGSPIYRSTNINYLGTIARKSWDEMSTHFEDPNKPFSTKLDLLKLAESSTSVKYQWEREWADIRSQLNNQVPSALVVEVHHRIKRSKSMD